MKQVILIGLFVAHLINSSLSLSNDELPGLQGNNLRSLQQVVHPTCCCMCSDQQEEGAAGTRLIKRATRTDVDNNVLSNRLIKNNEARHQNKHNKDIMGHHVVGDFLKLMLNPVELTKRIAAAFKLDFEKLSSFLGKNFLYGLEATFTPVVVSTNLVEKVFVPDACALKFACSMGAHLDFVKPNVLKLSSKIVEGSRYVKAFSDGIIGRDCGAAYPSCASNMLTVRKAVKEATSLESSVGFNEDSERIGNDVLAGLVGQQYQQRNPSSSPQQDFLGGLRSLVDDQLAESTDKEGKLFGLF